MDCTFLRNLDRRAFAQLRWTVTASWIDGWWEVVQEGGTYYYLLRIADGSAAWTYVRSLTRCFERE